MAAIQIITNNHPTLRKTAELVESFTPEIEALVTDLLDTLEETKDLGVGLSANQIDQLHRVFVAKIAEKEEDITHTQPTVFINPELVSVSDQTTLATDPDRQQLEGCLSLPNIYAFVERPLYVTLHYHTPDTLKDGSAPIEQKFSDYNAVVVQHELDHLNGILFTDHALEQGQKIYEIIEGKEPRMITL